MESSGGGESSIREEAEVELGERSELQMDAEQATRSELLETMRESMRRSEAKEKEKEEEEMRTEEKTFLLRYQAHLEAIRARAKEAAAKATRAEAAAREAEAAAREAQAVAAKAVEVAKAAKAEAAKAAEAEAEAAEKGIEAAMLEEAAGKFEAAPAVAEAAVAKAEEVSEEAAEEEMRMMNMSTKPEAAVKAVESAKSEELAAAVEEEEDEVEKEIREWKEQERELDELRDKIYLEDMKRLDERNKEKERSLKEKRSKKQKQKQRKKKMEASKAQEAAKAVEPAKAVEAAKAVEPANEADEEEMWIVAQETSYLKHAAEMRSIGEYKFAKHLERSARNVRKMPVEADRDPNAYKARLYRDNWDTNFGEYGPFDKITSIPPSCFADHHRNSYVSVQETLQIFSVKVGEIKKPLEWPLDVYGLVAVRDVVDGNRNMVFHRKRDNCQTITKEDSYLTLTGPTRAVVASVHPTDIEVYLKVKGATESEDKDLSALVVSSITGGPCHRAERSKLSTLELTYVRIDNSVEAAISVKVKSGSWPCGFRGLFTASTASFKGLEVVLLAFEGDKLPIEGDDRIELSRRVVCVELPQPEGKLIVSVQALHISEKEDALRVDRIFTPKQAGTSQENVKVGSFEMEVTVTWSLLSTFKRQYDRVLEERSDL